MIGRNTATLPDGALQAVLFDMDGTLMDSEKLWDVGLSALCDELGFTLDRELRARLVGMDQTESIEVLYEALGLPARGVGDSVDWLISYMKDLFGRGVVWQPGAQQLLGHVRTAGFTTALVTATGRELTNVIIGTIGPHNFEVTICGDEVAHNKPDPEPYRTAVKTLGLAPRDCLVIEDSMTGTTSARAAGCPVLAVPSEVPLTAGDGMAVIPSLEGISVADLRRFHAQLRT